MQYSTLTSMPAYILSLSIRLDSIKRAQNREVVSIIVTIKIKYIEADVSRLSLSNHA
jgi:hypothetical protein